MSSLPVRQTRCLRKSRLRRQRKLTKSKSDGLDSLEDRGRNQVARRWQELPSSHGQEFSDGYKILHCWIHNMVGQATYNNNVRK